MTDTPTAKRDSARALLPALEASNAELSALFQSLLSPSIAAALRTAPGTSPSTIVEPIGAAPASAAALLRDLDSRLPALRAAGSTGTVK